MPILGAILMAVFYLSIIVAGYKVIKYIVHKMNNNTQVYAEN